jgi:hypothetical protein
MQDNSNRVSIWFHNLRQCRLKHAKPLCTLEMVNKLFTLSFFPDEFPQLFLGTFGEGNQMLVSLFLRQNP